MWTLILIAMLPTGATGITTTFTTEADCTRSLALLTAIAPDRVRGQCIPPSDEPA